MASQYTTSNGQTLIVPGGYADDQIVATPSTVAANGILIVVGEADSGPSYSEELDLSQNAFGPDQKSEVMAKYGSGNLVDAFVGAVTASNDNNIKGSFTSFVPIKTNSSVKASTTLTAIGGGTYANLVAKSAGKPGNLITRAVNMYAQEQAPAIGPVIFASPQVVTDLTARVNGAAGVTIGGSTHLAVGATPTALVAAMNATALTNAGVTTSGGVARGLIGSATTRVITVSNVSGYSATFSATVAWAVPPVPGDILFIPSTSAFRAGTEGTYVVQTVGSAALTALKVIDAVGSGFARSAPDALDINITAAPADIECYSPVIIGVTSGTPVPGLGKTLELADNTTAVAGLFSNLLWSYNSQTLSVSRCGAVSTSVIPAVITSSQEYTVDLNIVRQKDGISENIIVGGSPVLNLGYKGTTAQAVIANGVMTCTLVGGASAGLNPVITLADFPTIGDLCQYFNSLGDFTAAPTLVTYASISPTRLDAGTYNFGTTWGAQTCRIKTDGADFLDSVNSESVLINITPPGVSTGLVGLPQIAALGFLSGGSKGGTANASIQAALDACQAVKGNLVVPLFSNDATIDISRGLTDASSTYTLASINTAVRAHALQMSQLKIRKRRLAILSTRDTFANAKINASNIANSRCAMTFQDVKDNNSLGSLVVFQPWMAAVKAAAMQAAGFYKDITHKYTTVSAATTANNDFNYNINSNLEDALTSGLLPLIYDGSGYKWVSDQTTYSVDDNFVFNSLQAMYALDIIMATSEQRMERAFVGQSLADVSATTAVTVFGAIMDDLARLKLIAPSDDAPRGFKDVLIRIVNGNAMVVQAQIKLATSIKFISIVFMVSAIQQSATG